MKDEMELKRRRAQEWFWGGYYFFIPFGSYFFSLLSWYIALTEEDKFVALVQTEFAALAFIYLLVADLREGPLFNLYFVLVMLIPCLAAVSAAAYTIYVVYGT